MNKMTFNDIKELLNSHAFGINESDSAAWMYGDVYSSWTQIPEDGEFKELYKQLGEFEQVEKFGGQGKGDDFWRVYYFRDHDIYIRFDGWYTSHEGADYNDMFEVKPVQITKTEYHRI